ncbi:MAG: DUF4925 domain-containing protein, partial [Muribaculaceae bacterium]|nr:DUF4925 domain-containing protein [Muribaculaceae bacterium]
FSLPATLMLLVASGCSDNDSKLVGNLKDKTYTASTGLELYYNGVEMPGKSFSFYQEGNNATLKGFSEFDLSQLSALGLSGELPCPGVIPGSPETVWNVSLTEKNGYLTFSGKDNNGICNYEYTGEINADRLKIYINDAVLNNQTLSGKIWRPASIAKDADGIITSTPFYIDWEIDPIPEIDVDLSSLLESLTTLPFIPVYNNTAYMSLSQALDQIVKTVAFRADGNILFTYISTTGGAARIAQTQPNGLQYSIPEQGVIKLYVNPLSLFGFILENASGSTPPEDVDLTGTGLYPSGNNSSNEGSSLSSLISSPTVQAMVKSLMSEILPQLATGIPLRYIQNGDELDIYIDTQASLGIIRTLIDSFLQNDEAVKSILSQLEKNPEIAPLLSDLPKFQNIIEQVLLNTSTLRIGFKFKAKQS